MKLALLSDDGEVLDTLQLEPDWQTRIGNREYCWSLLIGLDPGR